MQKSLQQENLILTQITLYPEKPFVYENGHILVYCHDIRYVKKVKSPEGKTISEITYKGGEVLHFREVPEDWLAHRVHSLEDLAKLKGDRKMQKNVIHIRQPEPKPAPVKEEFGDGPEFHTNIGKL